MSKLFQNILKQLCIYKRALKILKISFLLIFRVWFNLKPTLLLKDQQKPQLVTTGEWSGKKGPLVLSWSQEHLTLLGYAENFFCSLLFC